MLRRCGQIVGLYPSLVNLRVLNLSLNDEISGFFGVKASRYKGVDVDIRAMVDEIPPTDLTVLELVSDVLLGSTGNKEPEENQGSSWRI